MNKRRGLWVLLLFKVNVHVEWPAGGLPACCSSILSSWNNSLFECACLQTSLFSCVCILGLDCILVTAGQSAEDQAELQNYLSQSAKCPNEILIHSLKTLLIYTSQIVLQKVESVQKMVGKEKTLRKTLYPHLPYSVLALTLGSFIINKDRTEKDKQFPFQLGRLSCHDIKNKKLSGPQGSLKSKLMQPWINRNTKHRHYFIKLGHN